MLTLSINSLHCKLSIYHGVLTRPQTKRDNHSLKFTQAVVAFLPLWSVCNITPTNWDAPQGGGAGLSPGFLQALGRRACWIYSIILLLISRAGLGWEAGPWTSGLPPVHSSIGPLIHRLTRKMPRTPDGQCSPANQCCSPVQELPHFQACDKEMSSPSQFLFCHFILCLLL